MSDTNKLTTAELNQALRTVDRVPYAFTVELHPDPACENCPQSIEYGDTVDPFEIRCLMDEWSEQVMLSLPEGERTTTRVWNLVFPKLREYLGAKHGVGPEDVPFNLVWQLSRACHAAYETAKKNFDLRFGLAESTDSTSPESQPQS